MRWWPNDWYYSCPLFRCGYHVVLKKNARISWTKNKTEFYSQADWQPKQTMWYHKPEGKVLVGGQIITNQRYTNDTTLVARTSEELLELMKRVKAVSEQFKPYLNVEKITIMRSSWSSGVVNQWLSRMVEALLISGDDWLRPRPRHLLQHFQISGEIETSPEQQRYMS